ncbi:MAG: T9SS type A sorting domain-containing protein, partial [Ignavibacteriaceae bacterium]
DITWTGAISGNVRIKLYDDGDFDSEITSSTPNSGLYSWNIPIDQSPGTEYKVKITKVDDDDVTDKSDDDFTITGPPLDFKVDFLVSDNCSHLQNLIFGTAPDATDCFDLGYDRYAAPAPPLGIFDAVFTSCNDRFLKDIRETNQNDVTIWDVIYQRKSGCSTINFNWDPGQLPSGGNFHLIDFQTGGSLVNIDMRSTDNYTDIIDLDHLQIIFNYSTTFSTEIDEGFNMISLPLEVVSNFYLDLFPNAIPNTLFGFDEVYILTENIIPGEGYWLRFDSPETVTIEGTEIQMLELNLKLGWNMIGGPACNLPLSSIIDGAGIIIPNTLMGFNGVYYLADTILPGDGYWIRTNDSGTIILVCSALVPPLANLPKADETKSIFADLTGFITIDLEDSKGNSQRLFFAGNCIDGYLVKEYVGNVETGKREISDGMELLITNQNVDLLKIQLNSIIPTGVVLGQNYPNPFNPGTIIKYQLPFKANVKLQIINSLGQEIRILVNEEKAAGSHEVEFDGSKLASGIYFYRIQAVDLSSSSGQVFDETKKMILMK